jgi:hypothetical protein
VAQTVGVYYASNAVGRLVGTLSSGALYSYIGSTVVDGFGSCLMVSVGFAAVSCLVDFFLQEETGAQGECGAAACDAAGAALRSLWACRSVLLA